MDHPAYNLPLPEELVINILSYVDANIPEFHKYKIKLFSFIDTFTREQLLLFYCDFIKDRQYECYNTKYSTTELRKLVKERFVKQDIEHVHFIIKYVIPNFYEKAKCSTVNWSAKHNIEDCLQRNFKNHLAHSYISRSQTVSAFLLYGFEYTDRFDFKAKDKKIEIKALKALKNIEIK
jgi:hypothetical protein